MTTDIADFVDEPTCSLTSALAWVSYPVTAKSCTKHLLRINHLEPKNELVSTSEQIGKRPRMGPYFLLVGGRLPISGLMKIDLVAAPGGQMRPRN